MQCRSLKLYVVVCPCMVQPEHTFWRTDTTKKVYLRSAKPKSVIVTFRRESSSKLSHLVLLRSLDIESQ